jgi:hypothetical protein
MELRSTFRSSRGSRFRLAGFFFSLWARPCCGAPKTCEIAAAKHHLEALRGRFGYRRLKGAADVCGGCGQAMGMESIFACNKLKDNRLAVRGENRFRTLWQPIMFGVSQV